MHQHLEHMLERLPARVFKLHLLFNRTLFVPSPIGLFQSLRP